MKIFIEFETDNAAFDGNNFGTEVGSICRQAAQKVLAQRRRQAATVCTAPETADKLLDTNGNTVGSVRVER